MRGIARVKLRVGNELQETRKLLLVSAVRAWIQSI